MDVSAGCNRARALHADLSVRVRSLALSGAGRSRLWIWPPYGGPVSLTSARHRCDWCRCPETGRPACHPTRMVTGSFRPLRRAGPDRRPAPRPGHLNTPAPKPGATHSPGRHSDQPNLDRQFPNRHPAKVRAERRSACAGAPRSCGRMKLLSVEWPRSAFVVVVVVACLLPVLVDCQGREAADVARPAGSGPVNAHAGLPGESRRAAAELGNCAMVPCPAGVARSRRRGTATPSPCRPSSVRAGPRCAVGLVV